MGSIVDVVMMNVVELFLFREIVFVRIVVFSMIFVGLFLSRCVIIWMRGLKSLMLIMMLKNMIVNISRVVVGVIVLMELRIMFLSFSFVLVKRLKVVGMRISVIIGVRCFVMMSVMNVSIIVNLRSIRIYFGGMNVMLYVGVFFLVVVISLVSVLGMW